jgi:hypothetical protein
MASGDVGDLSAFLKSFEVPNVSHLDLSELEVADKQLVHIR